MVTRVRLSIIAGLLFSIGCGGGNKATPGKHAARIAGKPAKQTIWCSKKYGLCYADPGPDGISSVEQFVCGWHCTEYASCWDTLNAPPYYRYASQCASSCARSLAAPKARARQSQLKVLRCLRHHVYDKAPGGSPTGRTDCAAVVECVDGPPAVK